MNIKKLAVAAIAVSLFAGTAWAEVPANSCLPPREEPLLAKGAASHCAEPADISPIPPPPMRQAGETVFQQGQSAASEYMFSARMISDNGNDTLVIQNSWTASSGIVGFQETVSVSASNDTITLVYVTLLGGTTVATPATATTKFVGSFSPKPTIKVTLESGFPTNGCVPPPPGALAKANCGPGSYGRGGTLYYGGITVNGIETVTRTINMTALPLNVVSEWFCGGPILLCEALYCDRTRALKGTLTVGEVRRLTIGKNVDRPEYLDPWQKITEEMADYQQEICPPGSITPCKSTAPWANLLATPPQSVCPLNIVPKQDFEIVIGDGIDHIGDYAFHGLNSGCSMGRISVSIGKDVVTIGEYAFASGLWSEQNTSVTIPDNVKKIGVGAFSSSGITSVTIGAGVDTIMGSAFAYCENLKTVVSMNPVPPVLSTGFVPVFERIAVGACLYVPDESVAAYANWGGFECVKPLGETSISHRSRSVKNSAAAAVSVRGRTLNVRMAEGSKSSSTAPMQIRMIDMRGKVVARFVGAGLAPARPLSFSLTKIPAGRYFVEVRDGVRRDRTSVVVGGR